MRDQEDTMNRLASWVDVSGMQAGDPACRLPSCPPGAGAGTDQPNCAMVHEWIDLAVDAMRTWEKAPVREGNPPCGLTTALDNLCIHNCDDAPLSPDSWGRWNSWRKYCCGCDGGGGAEGGGSAGGGAGDAGYCVGVGCGPRAGDDMWPADILLGERPDLWWRSWAPHSYIYAMGDPSTSADPTGRIGWPAVIGIIIGVGGLGYLGYCYWIGSRDRGPAQKAGQDSGLLGEHHGPQDAYRHCVWMCKITRHAGRLCAIMVGRGHEWQNRGSSQPQEDEEMDSHNNAVGRTLGHCSEKNCADACMEAHREGKLRVLAEDKWRG